MEKHYAHNVINIREENTTVIVVYMMTNMKKENKTKKYQENYRGNFS